MTKSELRRISTLAAVRSLLGEGGGARLDMVGGASLYIVYVPYLEHI